MHREINVFDEFIDDILDSDQSLLKGELDLLLMQHIFNSMELEFIQELNQTSETFIAAQKLLKNFYDKFWYPFFGRILSKFVFLIEGKDLKKNPGNISKKNKVT